MTYELLEREVSNNAITKLEEMELQIKCTLSFSFCPTTWDTKMSDALTQHLLPFLCCWSGPEPIPEH